MNGVNKEVIIAVEEDFSYKVLEFTNRALGIFISMIYDTAFSYIYISMSDHR